MSGNPDNASVWDDADVYVSFDLDAALPATIDDDFPVAFERVGLLDGSAGFVHSQDEPRGVYRAWGAGVIKVSRQGAEVTATFTALEDNDTTERLGRPNLREKVLIAFETHEDAKVRRLISRKPASVRRNGDKVDKEDGLTMIPFQATIFPDTEIDAADEDQFWSIQSTVDAGS